MINKKTVLATIIALLIIFVPLTIASYFLKEKENPFDKNPGHDFYYKEMLWFYEGNDLINTYHCNTTSCDYAEYVIDDEDINYYKEGNLKKSEVINNNYVFIKDGALTNLYSLDYGKVLQSYKQIKTYNTNVFDNTYILQNQDNLWGAISVSENINSVLPFEYSFVGLRDNLNEDGSLNTDMFIVSKNNKWYLVSKDNEKESAEFDSKIVDFNNKLIVTKSANYHIYNYDKNEYLIDYNISDYKLVKDYLLIISNNILYIYKDISNGYLKSYNVSSGKLNTEIENNKIIIKIGENVIDTLDV